MTTIGPYASTGVGKPSLARTLAESRTQLDDLLNQLATGQKSSTYAGLGAGRSTSLAMRAKLASLDSYQATGTTVGVRIGVAASALQGLDNLGAEYKTVNPNEYVLTTGSVTIAQSQASTDLQEAINRLNVDVDGRFLFSGRSTDVKPVLSADAILSDNGDKTGLRNVIAERKLADLGADGRGRLNVSAVSGSSFTVSETGAGPFGFKISSLSSTLTGGATSGPTGTPPSITLGVTGTPKDGEQVRVGLTLPDGTTKDVVLTARAATSTATLQPGEFRVGATPAETATNLQASFDTSLKTTADTALVAASAFQAGEEFFNVPAGSEPARVGGFDATYATDADRIAALQGATSLDTTGTADKTVDWYVGEDAGDDPRKTAAATVDDGVTVAYGARANEVGTRRIVQTLAVFSSITFSEADANGKARYSELASRVTATLGSTATTADIKTQAVDLASANNAIKSAGERHTATKAVAETAISNVEGVSKEDVSLKILSLQNTLQASYQVTATLKSLSLVNFL